MSIYTKRLLSVWAIAMMAVVYTTVGGQSYHAFVEVAFANNTEDNTSEIQMNDAEDDRGVDGTEEKEERDSGEKEEPSSDEDGESETDENTDEGDDSSGDDDASKDSESDTTEKDENDESEQTSESDSENNPESDDTEKDDPKVSDKKAPSTPADTDTENKPTTDDAENKPTKSSGGGGNDSTQQCIIEIQKSGQPDVDLEEGLDGVSLETVLRDAGYTISTEDHQDNYAEWRFLETTTTSFEVTYIDSFASHSNVFGYYINGDLSTFTPVFQEGNHSDYPGAPDRSPGDTIQFTVTAEKYDSIGFAIATENGDTYILGTDNSLNPNQNPHAVSFGIGKSYVIGFEDLVKNSDNDFQDMVVAVTPTDCDEGGDDEGEAPDVILKADSSVITVGSPLTLKWSVLNDADECTASGSWSGSKDRKGAVETIVGLGVGEHVFTLTCANDDGTDTESVTVKVVGVDDKAPVVDIKANGSDGPYTLTGTTTTLALSWESGNNPDECRASGAWIGEKTLNGTETIINLATGSYTFTITCANDAGTGTDSVIVYVTDGNGGDDAPVVDLKVNGSDGPLTITGTTSLALTWTAANNPDECRASGDWSGEKTPDDGAETISGLGTGDYTFLLTCANDEGTHTDSVKVSIIDDNGGGDDPARVDLKANDSDGPLTLTGTTTVQLSWTTVNDPDSCVASGNWDGEQDPAGGTSTITALGVGDYTFTLTCANDDGTGTDSVVVHITDDNGDDDSPTVDLKVNNSDGPVDVEEGNNVNLAWTTTNSPDECRASGDWSGEKDATGGTQTIADLSEGNYTYTITCANDDGTYTDSVEVNITDDNGGGGGGDDDDDDNGRGGGGVSGGRYGSGQDDDREGRVLGIQSCNYLEDYLHIDWENDQVEVAKLQYFLSHYEGYNVNVTGTFNQQTFNAVVNFQERYFDEVLAPWGHQAGTGFVYITTKTKINEIVCNRQIAFTSAQQEEMNEFRSYLQSQGGGIGGIGVGGPVEGGGSTAAEGAGESKRSQTGATAGTSSLGVISDIVSTTTSTIATAGQNMLRGFAAAALSAPSDLNEFGTAAIILALILVIVYLFGTLIVNAQDTKGLSAKTIWARKLLVFIIGIIGAGVIVFFAGLPSLIIPLLVILITLSIILLWFINEGGNEAVQGKEAASTSSLFSSSSNKDQK